MTAPLSAGTRVTLTGTATGHTDRVGYCAVFVDRLGFDIWIPREALQVVVPPEPQWTVGDAVRIDGETLLRCATPPGSRTTNWYGPIGGTSALADERVSEAWSEGRVRVLYCQNQEATA